VSTPISFDESTNMLDLSGATNGDAGFYYFRAVVTAFKGGYANAARSAYSQRFNITIYATPD
jgi:hypothetical protein